MPDYCTIRTVAFALLLSFSSVHFCQYAQAEFKDALTSWPCDVSTYLYLSYALHLAMKTTVQYNLTKPLLHTSKTDVFFSERIQSKQGSKPSERPHTQPIYTVYPVFHSSVRHRQSSTDEDDEPEPIDGGVSQPERHSSEPTMLGFIAFATNQRQSPHFDSYARFVGGLSGRELDEADTNATVEAVRLYRRSRHRFPRYPQYASDIARRHSFRPCMWPRSAVPIDDLIHYGFYYLPDGDRAVCFHCGLSLASWQCVFSPVDMHSQRVFAVQPEYLEFSIHCVNVRLPALVRQASEPLNQSPDDDGEQPPGP